ncbi:MAG TPA: DUF5302 domain-containing protein [Pseudonocardiaceae bacterium]
MATDQPASASDDPVAGEGAADGEDETRRKFREALARKQGRAHLGGTTGATNQHPHAAPAKRGRTFRRKSG